MSDYRIVIGDKDSRIICGSVRIHLFLFDFLLLAGSAKGPLWMGEWAELCIVPHVSGLSGESALAPQETIKPRTTHRAGRATALQ